MKLSQSSRQSTLSHFVPLLESLASSHSERVLDTKPNNISFAITLTSFRADELQKIGGMLFDRNVTGCRVVKRGVTKVLNKGVTLENFGSSSTDAYQVDYLTAAVGIGMTIWEVDELIKRIDGVFRDVKKRRVKKKVAAALGEGKKFNNKGWFPFFFLYPFFFFFNNKVFMKHFFIIIAFLTHKEKTLSPRRFSPP